MAHARTFFEYFGSLGTCVLPAEVLDNTPCTDPETGLTHTSLRQRCSRSGQLCFAHVLHSCAEGLYWADVAANSNLADAEQVMLSESDLLYALAWDERLYWREPAQIRRLMQAMARERAPIHPCAEPAPPEDLFPVPTVPLTVVATVEVSTDELCDAFDIEASDPPPEAPQRPGKSPLGNCAVQQGLLRALNRALQQRLSTTSDPHAAQALQALSALVARVQCWQRQTRQLVVHVVREWCAAWHCPAWSLTLGVPEALLAPA
jgi:hypothetical protein